VVVPVRPGRGSPRFLPAALSLFFFAGWPAAQDADGPGDSPRSWIAETGFFFHANWVLVPVTAGGETGLWILDTGASSSVIDSTYALRLGAEWGGPVRITGATGQATVPTAIAPELEIAGEFFPSRRLATLDLAGLVRPRLGLTVHGILGQDFLRSYTIRIDFARRKVTFHDPYRFGYEGDGAVFTESLDAGLFRLPVTVDGHLEGSWVVDTGAGGLAFHHPYAEENDLLELPGARFMGADASGPSERKTVRFSSIELAGVTFPDPLIDVPLRASGAFGNARFDGNLGNYLFRYFVLYLDYPTGRLILEKGNDCCEKVPDLLSGLFLGLEDDDSIVVRRVLSGSCADEAGFEAGDIVTGLEGDPVSGPGGLWLVRETLKGESGNRLSFSVDRNGDPHTLTVRLADFFRRSP
jgi:hypothetical protein